MDACVSRIATNHRDLIALLGGAKRVSTILTQRMGYPVRLGTVSMMKMRDTIPDRYRPALAAVAGELKITLPADFIKGV